MHFVVTSLTQRHEIAVHQRKLRVLLQLLDVVYRRGVAPPPGLLALHAHKSIPFQNRTSFFLPPRRLVEGIFHDNPTLLTLAGRYADVPCIHGIMIAQIHL